MPSPDPTIRSISARLGAHELHAQGKTNTGPARAAFLEKFEREVDPEGVLEPEVRAHRAAHLRKAYFTRLALKSAQARRKGGDAA